MEKSKVALRQTASSFRPLSDREALAVAPNRLQVMRQKRLRSLQEALDSYPDVPVAAETLALLNNLQLQSSLPVGFRLKIVQGRFGVNN